MKGRRLDTTKASANDVDQSASDRMVQESEMNRVGDEPNKPVTVGTTARLEFETPINRAQASPKTAADG